MTTKKLASLFIAAGVLVGCAKEEDGETGATVSTTLTTTLGGTDDSTGGGSNDDTSAGTSASTTASTTVSDSSAEGPQDSSGGGGGCTVDDDCMEDSDCGAGESCLAAPACTCFGGADSSGGGTAGGCPAGETCEMTGQGGMACLAESNHCVLYCTAMMTCPDGMTCQGSVCHYDSGNLPMTGDANYPMPDAMNMCPDPTDGPYTFAGAPYVMCSPLCDGMGVMAPCVGGETGSAQGACLFNPDSSGDPC